MDTLAPRKKPAPRELNRHGKDFEKIVNAAFKDLHKSYPIRWEKVTDTEVAGNLVKKADTDFQLTIASHILGQPYRFNIECKASNQKGSLAQCFRSIIKGHQIGQNALLQRAGVICLFMFHSVESGDVEIWDAKPLIEQYEFKRTPLYAQPLMVVTEVNLPHFARDLVKDPLAMIDMIRRSRR